MSWLAGVFHYDLSPVLPAEEALLLQDAPWRPEGAGVYRGPGIVVVCAGPTGEPSMVARSAFGNACALDGRFHNRHALTSDLDSPGSAAASDVTLVLALYEGRGAGALSVVVGDWSLALWDAHRHTLLLASDYAGVRPLYYHVEARCLRWSSSLAHLSRWVGCEENLDEEYLANLLSYGHVGERTPYAGIVLVPPHTALEFRGGTLSRQTLWSLPVEMASTSSDGECEERFRVLFREAVATRLDCSGAACAELSGGLDSSSIVCMASDLIRSGSVAASELVTFSYTHPDSADEPFFRAVEQHCQVTAVHLDTSEFPPISAASRAGAEPLWWQPRFEELARRTADAGSRVLLTGQAGDLVTANWLDDSAQAGDYLAQGRVWASVREAFAWSRALRVPVYGILWNSLRSLAPWSGGHIAYAASSRLLSRPDTGSLTTGCRHHARLYDTTRASQPDLSGAVPSRRKHLAALHQLLRSRVLKCPEPLQHLYYSHPFMHRPLVEFMMTLPSSVTCRPGYPRRLLRRAFRNLLPEAVLNRRSKATYDRVFLEALRPLAASHLEGRCRMRLAECGLVDPAALRPRLRNLIHGLECNEPQLRYLLLLESWLSNRQQPVAQ
jgi:asparagine synthase (glutamine-hydrolysing)